MHRTKFAPGCVGPSSCGGLTMRILAAAMSGSDVFSDGQDASRKSVQVSKPPGGGSSIVF